MIITEYSIENNTPCVYVFSRDKEGKRTVKKDSIFRPYFYVLKSESKKFKGNPKVESIEDTPKKDIDGRIMSKIVIKLPEYAKELKKEVAEHFEADINYPVRYTIDKYEEIEGVPLSVIYLDIETNSSVFPNIQLAQDEITAIDCFNNFQKKNITFVWRADQQKRTIYNGKRNFKMDNDEVYEYDDYTMFFDNEREMLAKFLKYVQDIDPDMFTGWNAHDFDMRYIINRLNVMGLNYQRLSPMNMALTNDWGDVKIKGRIIFDMLAAVRKMSYGEMESYKLDNVAFQLLGEKKIEFEGTYTNLWQEDLDLFIEYNKKDTMLVYRIEKKKKIIQSFDETRRLSKCAFNDVFNNSRVVDSFMLSFAKDIVHPSKGGHEKDPFGGGKVLTPKKGIHEWVPVLDFKALYPKIISSLNASPETIAKEKGKDTVNMHIPYIDVEPFYEKVKGRKKFNNSKYNKVSDIFDKFFESNWDLYKQEFKGSIPFAIGKYVKFKDVYFNQKIKGFIPKILEYLFEKRIEMQTERDKFEYGTAEYNRLEFKQYAFKVLMNSFYGVLGHHKFRWYRPELAASTTFVGRNAILWCEHIAKKKGYSTLYGDTDSVFIPCKERPLNEGKENEDLNPIIDESIYIARFLQKSYDDFAKIFNMHEHHLKIEFEKTYRRIFFGQAKKRYAGMLAYYKGKAASKIDIKGFEVVRADQSKLAKKTQKEVFLMLVKGTHTKIQIIDYVKSIIKRIKHNEYDYETIGQPKPLKKPLSEYKTRTPMVKAVSYSNRFLQMGIRPGERFFLIHTLRIPNKPPVEVIAIRENKDVPEGIILNYRKHTEEATVDKMRAIFDGLGWHLIELTGQKSLTDY